MSQQESLRETFLRDYAELRSWRKVAEKHGVTKPMAYRVAKEDGYEPKDSRIRLALGLPELKLAPVCPIHGVVHVSRRCPGPKRKYRDLFDIPPAELRWMLENREEMP